jgi:transcriptional regulator with XRE-family HTH domain
MVKAAPKVSRASSTLGGRIRVVRKAWGWTQEALAQALGNDRQIVSYWELDKAKPTRSAMQLLAQVLNLSLDVLVSGDGFSIPDMPESGDTAQRMKTVRRALEDLVPSGHEAAIQTVDLQAGSVKAVTLRDAKAFLERSHKGGLMVWMVAMPPTMDDQDQQGIGD